MVGSRFAHMNLALIDAFLLLSFSAWAHRNTWTATSGTVKGLLHQSTSSSFSVTDIMIVLRLVVVVVGLRLSVLRRLVNHMDAGYRQSLEDQLASDRYGPYNDVTAGIAVDDDGTEWNELKKLKELIIRSQMNDLVPHVDRYNLASW